MNARYLGVNAFPYNDSGKNNMAVYKLNKNGVAYTSNFQVKQGVWLTVCAIAMICCGTVVFSLRDTTINGTYGTGSSTATGDVKAHCFGCFQ